MFPLPPRCLKLRKRGAASLHATRVRALANGGGKWTRHAMAGERPLTGRIELHSWRDFTKILKVMGVGKWIYRGHENVDWGLKSTLDRHVEDILKVHKDWSKAAFTLNLPRAEFFAISKFREMARKYQELDSDAAALIAMQHYGAKTRLLDFTMSIMVALFFAYEKRATGKKRAIFAVNYGSLMNQDGVWSGYQSFLKRIAAEEQEKRKIDREGERVWWNLESQFENHYFQRYTAEDAAANIWSCASGSAKGIIPLYKPAYNGRQTAQAGIELMPRTFDGFAENLAVALKTTVAEIEEPKKLITDDVSHLVNIESKLPSALVKFVFDADMENDAVQILDQANINAATIYPDMEGVAKSVRYSDTIVLGPTNAKKTAKTGWSDLIDIVQQIFPTWNGRDVVAFLEEMKVNGLDLKRLVVLRDVLDGPREKVNSNTDSPAAIGETDVQFIRNAVDRIGRLASIANILIPCNDVFTCSLDDAIRPVTETMVKNSYSHVPVLDTGGKVTGVFSESTMLEMSKTDIGNLAQATIRDIAEFLPMEKHTADVFKFVPKNDAVLHLRQLCDEALKKRKRIGMFFVTENGKSDEPLLGILTVWDIAGALDLNDI